MRSVEELWWAQIMMNRRVCDKRQHRNSQKPNGAICRCHTITLSARKWREVKELDYVTLQLSLPDVILASRFSTRLSLLNPSPSLGISSSPLRLISPRAVTAAIVSKGAALSKNAPAEEIVRFTAHRFCVSLQSPSRHQHFFEFLRSHNQSLLIFIHTHYYLF